MERLSLFCLSLLIALTSCNTDELQRASPEVITQAERDTLIAQKFKQFFKHHQGTPKAMTLLDEILALDSTNAEAWREKSIPYLKRGFPDQWFKYYEKAVQYDPKGWIGWRGYCYLYFYKDFKRAIDDFNATDTLTADFTDYPQAQSVHYMRGLCYYGLQQYDSALAYFQRYIDEEMSGSGGFDFIDQTVFLYRGLIHQKSGDHLKALEEFKLGLKIFEQSSDLHYHISRSHQKLGNLSLAKSEAKKAKEYFEMGYYHHRSYIEVMDQIYNYDIEQLLTDLKLNI